MDETRIITAIYISMNDSPFAQFFLPLTPFAHNAVHPGSVRPPVFFVQGLFILILCMNNILWSIVGACVKDIYAFLVNTCRFNLSDLQITKNTDGANQNLS